MENATKALIMAAAVLIAIMIVSMAVYVFNRFSEYDMTEQWSDAEIENFNSKLEPYCGEGISGSQVNALISLVRQLDYAAQNSDGDSLYLDEITYPNGSITVGDDYKVEESDVKTVTTGTYYTVTPTYSSSGRITSIKVEE